ncbi:hypothetical protein [Flavobacterium sp. FlaQc-48]|uniref:hypothetical protein n=1 Tax=Flavobacterium sp. FlaQc-48 TaxID=3374181 RepID=UPI003756972E
MKKSLILIVLIVVSCSSINDKYFEMVKGEWQITKLYYKEEDISSTGHYLMGFEKHNHSWIMKGEDRSNNFISSDYKIFKDLDTLKMSIKNCEDKRFDGIYNFYLDTIRDDGESYLIQLALDKEDSYIQAIRPRLKYNTPQEYEESLKNKGKE